MYNRQGKYFRLVIAITAAGFTQEQFAGRMGITKATLARKLSGHISWSLDDAYRAGEILGIPDCRLFEYFPR